MDTSYGIRSSSETNSTNSTNLKVLKSNSLKKCGYISIALGVITLIGSLIATGCLYSQVGYTSFAIGGAGAILCIMSILLSRIACTHTTIVITQKTPSQEMPQTIKNQSFRNSQSDDVNQDRNATQATGGSSLSSTQSDPNRSQATISQSLEIKNTQTHKSNPILPLVRKVETITKPDLPELPHIFDLKLDASHPLSKALPNVLCLKQNKDSNSCLNSGILAGIGPEELFGESDLDNAFFDIPISFWIKPDRYAHNADVYEKFMKDPKAQQQVKAINARINDFDQTIQLKERLLRLNCHSLMIRALFPAWSDSPFKLALMMDDELMALSVSSLTHIDHAIVMYLLDYRILKLGEKKKDTVLPITFTKDTIEKMLVIDLQKLEADNIHKCPTDFPPITFLLIAFSELKKIETNRLNTNQINLIFSYIYLNENLKSCFYVQLLSPKQINDCIPLVTDKKLFANLSEVQILQFDFSQMDQEIFNAMFKSHSARRLLQSFELDRIYELSKFFGQDYSYWEKLSNKQILNLDYSKIDQPAFDAMFDYYRTKELLEKITDPQLRSAKHLIGPELKKKLSPEQQKLLEE